MRQTAKWRAREEALKEEIERVQFLAEWVAELEEQKQTFGPVTAALNAVERRQHALKSGFRSWSDLEACQAHYERTLVQFVEHEYFQELWKKLRAADLEYGFINWYGPHNGGVPLKLLESIEDWYKAPKFTSAELAKHNSKIIKACDELSTLLEKVSPGHFGDNFSALHPSEAQAERLFECFASPKKRKHMWGASPYAMASSAAELLKQADVTPIWALQNIKASAQRRVWDILPTKVRAPNAFRTYIIECFCGALSMGFGHNSLPITDQLIADVVSLLSYKDCSADDVRKAMMDRRQRERAGLGARGMEDSQP